MGKSFLCARRTSAAQIALSAAAAAAFVFGSIGTAQAVGIDTGNPDVTIRWDNTVKYTAAMRVGSPDSRVYNNNTGNTNMDDGDLNFKSGDMTSNRGDLLTEFDLDYQKRMGFRVSGAAWYDQVYNDNNSNKSPATNNNQNIPFNHFQPATQVLHGKDLELLDAFVYRNFDLGGDQAFSMRVGRHSLLYGETLFYGSNGIAGAQAPIDLIKALSLPSAQFKEIMMPVGQASGTLQLSSKVSLGGYYQFEYRKDRLPGVGSYFSFADFVDAGGYAILAGGPAYFSRGPNIDPKTQGQGGMEIKWKANNNWEFGGYFANFHSKDPKFYLTPSALPPVFTAYGLNVGQYRVVYPTDIKVYGVSFATLAGDTNISGEFSIRDNQPFAGNAGDVILDLTGKGNNSNNPLYPVGKSAHGNISAITLFPAGPLWEGAAWVGEIATNRRITVDNGMPLDPNVTRSAWALWTNFEPSYFQVLPGLDVTLPITVGWGIAGRSSLGPTAFAGNNEGTGNITLGITGTYQDRWKAALQYTTYFGTKGSIADPTHGNIYSYRQLYADRDWVALTLSTSF